jgi:hypothetical protein
LFCLMPFSLLGSAWMRWGRIQGSLCILHGLLLVLGVYLQHEFQHMYISAIVVSAAMGIQNTVSSMYAPMAIRYETRMRFSFSL